MVRFRVGRFASELYYTGTKAVLPEAERRRRAGFILGHSAYITALGEYICTEMIPLRSFAAVGAAMLVGYQLMQPKVQVPSVAWNAWYVLINIVMIYKLVEPPPEFEGEEAGLFAVLGDRLTAWQFDALLRIGSLRGFADGSKLTQHGTLDDGFGDREVWIIASGECEVRFEGLSTAARVGPGGVVGDLALLSGRPPSSTVEARGDVRCLCVSHDKLKRLLAKDAALRGAIYSLLAGGLVNKVVAMNTESKELQYGAMLEVVCGAAVLGPRVFAEVAQFQRHHHISHEEHGRVVATVPQCVERQLALPCGQ